MAGTNIARSFNVTGSCNPVRHYMVDIQDKLQQIKTLVDDGAYFTINRARQFGKTTTLRALAEYLKDEYTVISLDFQRIGSAKFATEHTFSEAFVKYLSRVIRNEKMPLKGIDIEVLNELEEAAASSKFALDDMFPYLHDLCESADKPIVLFIDEIDSATNNQVFLDFLAQLRADYLERDIVSAFHSVILAGVHDVKNIKRKLRPDEEHKVNSPWNIAANFKIDMSFSADGIAGMLREYEVDYHTGMNVKEMAQLISDYTSGYPFLVSRLCKLMDEEVVGAQRFPDKKSAWTKEGFLEAEKILLNEKNTLFESLIGKLFDFPSLDQKLYSILFSGNRIMYNPDDLSIDMALMYGFVKNDNGTLIIANRIFETRLYNYYLATDHAQSSDIFICATQNKPMFIHNGRLDMDLILKKFVEYFDQIYEDKAEIFDEEEGRRRFLLFLRPIINGVGNYYIEAQTRNARRMDVVVDYQGERFVIELKIWHGAAYNERGEQQLSDYLDYFKLKKGYMLSYNFNQKKTKGVKEIHIGDRILVEAVV